jgi:hypothetical protein
VPGWTLFPHFILRATGFPWELLERLRCPRAGELARRCRQAEEALRSLREHAPRIRHPSRAVLAALKAGRPVPLEHVEEPALFEDWNRRATELQQAREQLERAFEEELQAIRAALRELSEDPRLREAVASSSPPVYGDLEKGRWSARLERQLASYVQRLCAKNETMSFFGPINYGRMDPAGPDGIALAWSGPLVLKARRTHVASWLVKGISEAITFDPELVPWLVLRKKSFADPPLPKEGGSLSAETAELLGRLVRAVDGARRLSLLAEELGCPLEQVAKVARLGCSKHLLTHQLELPSASPQPLLELIERLSGFPGPVARSHLEGLSEILARMERYGGAAATAKVRLNEELRSFIAQRWGVRSPLEGRQEQGSAGAEGPPQAKQHTHAHFYVDRLPMREECGGDLRVTVGGARAAELARRLEGPLELLGRAAESTRRRAREQVARLLGSRSVPFWKVVAAFSDRPIPYDDSLSEWIAGAIADPRARRYQVEVPRLPAPPASEGLPLICSVDLLIGARDVEAWGRGEYEVVMGDIHDTALVWGWALQFHDARQRVEAEMIQALGQLPRSLPVVTVLASRRTGLLPAELPGPVIELGGVSTRPSAWRLPFDDLLVVSDGQSAHLWSQSLRSEVCLYNGELESLVHTAFALPRIRPPRVDLGAHTPRVELDGIILQREQWKLSQEQVGALLSCKDDRERLRCATALWDELGLPEAVFAKLPGERKPVLVDPCSPYVLRSFLNLLEHRGGAVVSEMVPAPSQLWLKAPTGRHTAELRCTFLRGGGGP